MLGVLGVPCAWCARTRPLWYPGLRSAAQYAWCWVSSCARCALRLPHSLVDHSSTTLPYIPSGPTFGQPWQSAALVLRRSAALALGCSGARSVPRLAIPTRGDTQPSAASALSGHLPLRLGRFDYISQPFSGGMVFYFIFILLEDATANYGLPIIGGGYGARIQGVC